MSKVSVVGSQAVMPTVIETLHELNLVHLSDYDGSWSGFENGTPLSGAEDTSEKLVTVRSLQDALDMDDDPPSTPPGITDAELETRLPEIRAEVNELDDQRDELRDRVRAIDERIEGLEPFAELGIDLDLLKGYETIDILVGEGDATAIDSALTGADEIDAYETYTGGDIVAIAAAGDGEDPLGNALAGVAYTPIEIPDGEGTPSELIADLEAEKAQLQDRIEDIEADLADIRADVDTFLWAAERYLSVQVEQLEVPLQFATSKRSFIAEGWIPTAEFDRLETALRDAVGDRLEIEELERADYEAVHDDDTQEAAADGGQPASVDEVPPTKMKNSRAATPFEELVRVVAHPKYSELDPTLIVFLTFPFMFGFMIGDIAYGVLYMLLGYGLWQVKSDVLNALGTVAMWAGGFTILFGVLYNDFLGMKLTKVDLPVLGVLHKGYKPDLVDPEFWVLSWIILAIVFGVVHMTTGWIMNYINERAHNRTGALIESSGWIMAVIGLYVWLFSSHLAGDTGPKPEFIAGENALWFIPNIPASVGLLGLAAVALGIALITYAEGFTGVIEIPSIMLGQTLSYLRIPAVLLAKGGMAMVVLMLTGLILGAGETRLVTEETIYTLVAKGELLALLPNGVTGILLVIVALVLFTAGHLLVFALGITAAGIQMLRLEYVEFFQRFYEGGGRKYNPFGRNTNSITEE